MAIIETFIQILEDNIKNDMKDTNFIPNQPEIKCFAKNNGQNYKHPDVLAWQLHRLSTEGVNTYALILQDIYLFNYTNTNNI